jgi:hypothetical protein
MQRHAMSWFISSPPATAVVAAVVVALAALLETTLLAPRDVRPLRSAPTPTPVVPQAATTGASPIGFSAARAATAPFRQPASRDAVPGRCRAPVRLAGPWAIRPAVQG